MILLLANIRCVYSEQWLFGGFLDCMCNNLRWIILMIKCLLNPSFNFKFKSLKMSAFTTIGILFIVFQIIHSLHSIMYWFEWYFTTAPCTFLIFVEVFTQTYMTHLMTSCWPSIWSFKQLFCGDLVSPSLGPDRLSHSQRHRLRVTNKKTNSRFVVSKQDFQVLNCLRSQHLCCEFAQGRAQTRSTDLFVRFTMNNTAVVDKGTTKDLSVFECVKINQIKLCG